MSDAPDLVRHARETRIAVIGGGIAGLVAAYECAKVGVSVTLFEASDRLGGTIDAAEFDGIRVDAGADRWAASSEVMRELVDHLSLAGEVVAPLPGGRWIAGLPSTPNAAPLPSDSVLGIPANPWGDDARRFIGWSGAWRAYLDRLRPPLTIGHAQALGELVRGRMGAKIVDRMVAPLSLGVFGVHPDDIDVQDAAPGLSSALTRTGSLAGAVGELGSQTPDPAVLSLRGGLVTLVDALAAALDDLAADVRLGAPVTALHADGDRWRLEVGGETAETAEADAVIVAADGPSARSLLHGIVTLPASHHGDELDVTTLLVDAPALDDAPRGHEVHAFDGSASVVHATAVWEWLAGALPAGHHVLRVTLPAQRAGGDRTERARAAAAALLGVEELRVVSAASARRYRAAPAAVRGHAQTVDTVRAALEPHPTLAVVGAWIAGSGLARTVAAGIRTADSVRSRALWSDSGAV
ncbi:protoporphyrinogen/coproporphyrinogen oxidase [Microbacterium sp. bgisy189]|uniref:protoporphyrinogen/coproporphyrinogen oxidase n=1 Tax=Microbacterium sp. bgisy189 TaxID=3413798 RepID=UPI003EB8BC85